MSITAGSINLLSLHVYVHYHYKTKLPACIWPSVQMCVEGTTLLFQVDAVVFQNALLPNSLKLFWNFRWLNIAVSHFTSGSQTIVEHREPGNTMCFCITASWTVRIQVLGGMRTQLVK